MDKKEKKKFFIKFQSEKGKKIINLTDIKNNWDLLYKKIIEFKPNLNKTKFVCNLPKDLEIPNLKYFYDQNTYDILYNHLEKEYQKDKNKFTNVNAPIFTFGEFIEKENKKENEKENEKNNEKENEKENEKSNEIEKENKIIEYQKLLEEYLNNKIDFIKKSLLNDNFKNDIYNGYYKYIEEDENKKFIIIHENIQCNYCNENDIIGKRFICSECNNFNLCENCEKLNNHNKEHCLIQINKEIIDKNNYFEYQNLICENERIYNFKLNNFQENFEIKIINIGENDLKNCFFMPISYRNNYLIGNKFTIDNHFKKGETNTINIKIKNIPEKTGIYYSKWRMFTTFGIPFGQVLYMKFNIEK